MATFKFTDNIKISGRIVVGAESYPLWQTSTTSGSFLSGFAVQQSSPLTTRIDWGDGSALEDLVSDTKYNHTFN